MQRDVVRKPRGGSRSTRTSRSRRTSASARGLALLGTLSLLLAGGCEGDDPPVSGADGGSPDGGGSGTACMDAGPASCPRGFTQVAAGAGHTCGIRMDGTLWCWGQNREGQLGVGDEVDRSTPTQAGSATDWVTVAVDSHHSCGIRADGTLWCWGRPVGSSIDATTPEQVGSEADWQAVAVAESHTCGIRAGGTLWCWGLNLSRQLGLGDVLPSVEEPTQVGSATDWQSVSAGRTFTCGIRAGGTLWCWGDNTAGQLGLGDAMVRNMPAQVGPGSSWLLVAAGHDHTCGIRMDGSLWCWGDNTAGQLGLGDTMARDVPTPVGTMNDWASVTVGSAHGCAVRADDSLWCWGASFAGQTGLGRRGGGTSTPTQVGSACDWQTVVAGWAYTCGIHRAGRLDCWGVNEAAQLGLGATSPAEATPMQVDTCS